MLPTLSRYTVDAGDASVTRQPELVRNLSAITDMLKESGLPTLVKERSVQVFTALGEAEAKTHGSTLDQVCTASSDRTCACHQFVNRSRVDKN